MDYYLIQEPNPGTQMAQAFDAIDQQYGTDPFSQQGAVSAICNVLGVDSNTATRLFNDLVNGQYIG